MFLRDQAALFAITTAVLLFATPHSQAQRDGFDSKMLDGNVNTQWTELAPLISPDGQQLYFIRKNSPDNIGGVKDPDDIYISTLQSDGTWGKATNIGPPLNTPGSDALLWISSDGNTALVHNGKMIRGKELGLAITRKKNGKWGAPSPISIKGFDGLSDYYQATITPDEKYLMFASAPRPEVSPYNFDIYYCPVVSKDLLKWGEPVAFEWGTVNSPFAEAAPFVASDNRTLYFVSDRPNGTGKGDIYESRRTGDDWTKMTSPQIVEGDVNTHLYEAGMTISPDGKWHYVSRITPKEIGGFGRVDLFKHKIPESRRINFDFTLVGKLIDKETGEELAGNITARRLDKDIFVGKTASDRSGNFSMVLIKSLQYKVEAQVPGYVRGGNVLDFRTEDPGDNYEVVIRLVRDGSSPDITPVTTEPPTLLFATGSATLSSKARQQLRAFYKSLAPSIQRGSLKQIQVTGHTDSTGTSEDNQRLSQRRAQSVRNQLIQLGVPSSLIRTLGKGEDAPAASNGTAQGRSANRRVEIVL